MVPWLSALFTKVLPLPAQRHAILVRSRRRIEVFSFYNGNSQAEFSGQREYYGRRVIMSVKYGFGAVPGTRARGIRGLACAPDHRTRNTFSSLSLAGREEFLVRLT